MLKHLRFATGFAALWVFAGLFLAPGLMAQDVNQIALTEKQILALIAAQADFTPLAGRLAEANDTPDPDLIAKLEAAAKKHGFSNFEEYRDVDNNIFQVLEGLDRETGEYTSPAERLKQELAELEKDTSIPAQEKKQLLEEVNEEMKFARSVQHKENITLVKKHLDKLSKLVPEDDDAAGEYGSEGAVPRGSN